MKIENILTQHDYRDCSSFLKHGDGTETIVLVLRVKGGDSEDYLIPFLLDSGTQRTTVPFELFSTLKIRTKPTGFGSTKTLGGEIPTESHLLDISFPEFRDSRFKITFDVSTVSLKKWSLNRVGHEAKRMLRRLLKRRLPSQSNVELFRKGKIGILATSDFIRKFDYYRTKGGFWVRRRT